MKLSQQWVQVQISILILTCKCNRHKVAVSDSHMCHWSLEILKSISFSYLKWFLQKFQRSFCKLLVFFLSFRVYFCLFVSFFFFFLSPWNLYFAAPTSTLSDVLCVFEPPCTAAGTAISWLELWWAGDYLWEGSGMQYACRDWRTRQENEVRIACDTRVYPKVSGLDAWCENCKWYSSLSLYAVVSVFCVSL
jgi:hypothetical protein